jgi:psiF repeat
MRTLVNVVLLSLAISTGSALAQDTPAPAGHTASGKVSAADKKAISKSCSDQANAKGLHGAARKKFRSGCKRAGGKVAE